MAVSADNRDASSSPRESVTYTLDNTYMTYYSLWLDPDDASIIIKRYDSKETLLDALRRDSDGTFSLEDYATDTDIGERWESSYHKGKYQCILIRGEIVTPILIQTIKNIDIA